MLSGVLYGLMNVGIKLLAQRFIVFYCVSIIVCFTKTYWHYRALAKKYANKFFNVVGKGKHISVEL